MRCAIFLLFIALGAFCEERHVYLGNQHDSYSAYNEGCIDDRDLVRAFRAAHDSFTVKLFKTASPRANYFFTMSPLSAWITLAAIAEGADYTTQKKLFKILQLPEDYCSRQKFYQLATTRVTSTNHVRLIHTRALVIDEAVTLNPNWYNLVRQYSLLQVIQAPIKRNPTVASLIAQQITFTKMKDLNLKGNSVLLESMDYNGLWTTAFSDAEVTRAPFYSVGGIKIGSVDLMKVKRRVRIGYVQSLNCKIIELPIGTNGEYTMIFALVVNKDPSVEPALLRLNNNTLTEVVASLQESYLPIDISIPRFVINSKINMMEILEELSGVTLWNNPDATRFVSSPPAQPSSYIQRATISLNNAGIYPPPIENPTYLHATEEERYWNEFVADRPFMFALLERQTYTCLMATFFTQPTYRY